MVRWREPAGTGDAPRQQPPAPEPARLRNMDLKTLQRICGIALGLGAVLIAIYSIVFSLLFPTEILIHDLGPVVPRPAWTALGLRAFVAVLSMMLGFGGVYTLVLCPVLEKGTSPP